MISESYDLSEFFRNVSLNDISELIFTAEQEATSAERALYHPRRALGASDGTCREYVVGLKSLIGYLRYHMRPPVAEKWRALFHDAEGKLGHVRHAMIESSMHSSAFHLDVLSGEDDFHRR